MDGEVRAATANLLESTPEVESELQTVLEVDRDGPWTFAEIPLDSGAFGELVSIGVAEQTDEGYRLVDRDAVEAALKHGHATSDTSTTTAAPSLRARVSIPELGQVLAVSAVLAFVAVVRIVPMHGSTFRDGRVVLASNDPYMYHAAAIKLFASERTAFDLAALADLSLTLTGTPIRLHDTLMIVFTWWGSALLGGDGAVEALLAWYPPVVGVLTGLAVFAVTTRISGDYRAGLAATVLLAVTPAHAFRTALGFGDHHAFDYLWLVVTLAAVVVIARARHDRQVWLHSRTTLVAVGVGGLAITAQLAAWRGGPLYLLPIALYALAHSVVAVRRAADPLAATAPLMAMLSLATLLTGGLHVGLGWLPPYRALAPALVLVGTFGVVGVATLGQQRGATARTVLAADLVVGAVSGVLTWLVIPTVSDALTSFFDYLARYGASGIAETQSLFAGSLGSIAAPILLFGFVFFLGLPYAIWAGYRGCVGDGRPDLLVVAAYTIVFTLLSMIQNRFAGQLALCIAPFAGIGFMHLADRTEILAAPELFAGDASPSPREDGDRDTVTLPSGRTIGYLLVLFLLIGGLGAIQTPIKMDQIAIDDDTAATGTWIAGDAGVDTKATSPYVLSEQGRSRALNFLAGGHYSTYEDYGYALDTYEQFVRARSHGEWYDRLAADGVDYVVIDRSVTEGLPPEALGARLSRAYGSASGEISGLGHYRATTEAGDRVVFAVVPGARLIGETASNATVVIETTVDIDGQTVTYTRRVSANASGAYSVTVPYPGTYTVDGTTVEVSEGAVQDGATVRAAA